MAPRTEQHANFVRTWTHPERLARLETMPLHPRLVDRVRDDLTQLQKAPHDEVLIGHARRSLANAMAGDFVAHTFREIFQKHGQLTKFQHQHEVRVYGPDRLGKPLDPKNFDNERGAPSFSPRRAGGALTEAMPILEGREALVYEIRIGGGNKHSWGSVQALIRHQQEVLFGRTSQMLITATSGDDIYLRVADPEAVRAASLSPRNWQAVLHGERANSAVYPALSAQRLWAVPYLDQIGNPKIGYRFHPFQIALQAYVDGDTFFSQPAHLQRVSHAILNAACNIFPDYVNNEDDHEIKMLRTTDNATLNKQVLRVLRFIKNVIEDKTYSLDTLKSKIIQFLVTITALKGEEGLSEYDGFFDIFSKVKTIVGDVFTNPGKYVDETIIDDETELRKGLGSAIYREAHMNTGTL